MSELVLDSVGKIFAVGDRYRVALRDVSLGVASGEFVCLLGASGCGKTTVLNLVAGFSDATYGSISVDGQPVREPGPDRGVVFQQHALFPWMSVEQNVAFGLRMRRVRKSEQNAVVERYLRMIGLWEHRDAWPKALSGGMQQRVAIARALANDPKVLLMDEPFAALDAQTRRNMQAETERIWLATRCTTLFVTHSIDEAVRLGDRIVLMASPGRVIEDYRVDLPRPRNDAAPDYLALRTRIEAALVESMRQPTLQDEALEVADGA